MALPAEFVPADVTYEIEPGKLAPIAEHPFVKDSPDVPTFFKRVIDQHREIGARVPVRIERQRNADGTFGPKIEAVEAWRKDHLPKLYDAGILDRPPSKPEEYEIKKPENLSEGVNWSDERAAKFAQLGVKHGISKAAMNEFLALHRDAVAGTAAVMKTSYDDTMLALKREYGDKFEQRLEDSKRLNRIIFKTPEEIAFMEETGLGNHPILTSLLMRLAPYAQNDSSLVESMNSAGAAPSTANVEEERGKIRDELADIMSNPQNPKHLAYRRNDPSVMAYIQGKYEALYGKGTVEIAANSGIQTVRTQ